jgi:very-short-patch-repair endonuclease
VRGDGLRGEEGRAHLEKRYVVDKWSTYEVAEELGVSPSKVRRLLIFHRIPLRSHSEAQKVALDGGRVRHPTKGMERTEEEKLKIARGMAAAWEGMGEEERGKRTDMARSQWEGMTEEARESLCRAAHVALRKTATEGSKLERFLLAELRARGHVVDFHRQFLFSSEKMHVDLFVADASVAIEVDGPTHYEAIFGTEQLSRNIRGDRVKSGLLVGAGYRVIRVRQECNTLSRHRMEVALEGVLGLLEGPVELVSLVV